ncbi:hypothetical protein [Paenibacillus dendritiformis]|nr:hypothetical protein [Paenibacillus dendritiformis]CAH8769585.1 hypothetical protein H7S4_002316 [Paenibacillus dendritiformis]
MREQRGTSRPQAAEGLSGGGFFLREGLPIVLRAGEGLCCSGLSINVNS